MTSTPDTTTTPAATQNLLLPEGTRLVHIGPPKTGTSALQSAFHRNRDAIADQGVHYAGPTRQPTSAIYSLTGRANPTTGGTQSPRDWNALVREIKRSNSSRVVVSSEFFADAPAAAIARAASDLERDRVRIVVTLRPLARILPSQWQQYVQSGMRVAFDTWLDRMLNQPESTLTPTFWMRHRHDRLVGRWVDAFGSERVTVVALDELDHGMVLRTFEALVGLRNGTLVPDEDRHNRSMTLPEIEVIRAFNTLYKAEGLGTPLHTKVMRFGAASYMKTREPDPDEPRLETPQWALDRAGEIAREMVAAIVASGVQVIGDPLALTQVPKSRLDGDRQPDVSIPPRIAASAAMGVLIASGLARGVPKTMSRDGDEAGAPARGPDAFIPRPTTEPLELVRIPTIQLGAVLIRRLRAAFAARTHALIRRVR